MEAPAQGVAIAIFPKLGEIYPLDLSGLSTLPVSVSKWKQANLGCILLLRDGTLVEIIDAQIKDDSLGKRLAAWLPLTTLEMTVKIRLSEIGLNDVKKAISSGIKDQFSHFYSDENMKWGLLRKTLETALYQLERCQTAGDLAELLDFPPISECLPHL